MDFQINVVSILNLSIFHPLSTIRNGTASKKRIYTVPVPDRHAVHYNRNAARPSPLPYAYPPRNEHNNP